MTKSAHVVHSAKRAFSLVELSIVLVILGLLVGGVLTGKSLIKAAELRSVPVDYNRFVAATNTFKDKYAALPGDMTNATQFWGVAGGTGNDPTCRETVSTDARTCNGDGNGLLYNAPGSWEYYRYWQHLTNAGLIEGKYNGNQIASTTEEDYAASMPRSKIRGSFWMMYGYSGGASGTASDFAVAEVGNYFSFFDFQTEYSLTPEEAWNIDKKMDDGVPSTGKVISAKGSVNYIYDDDDNIIGSTPANPCTNLYGQLTDAGAVYNTAYTEKACYLSFFRAF